MPSPLTKPTVIVLAAGRGERFFASGGTTHKLQALIRGKTVLAHTLTAVQASGLPFHVVTPNADEMLGMGDSIARGIAATPNASAWLVLPADLPMIDASSLLAVASALHSSQAAVVQAFVNGKAAHPVGFAALCKERLLCLHGDEGARGVVQYYKALGQWQALTLTDTGALQDVDTVADLQAMS
jgi:molybdenum cofactor cytidylyltransferase